MVTDIVPLDSGSEVTGCGNLASRAEGGKIVGHVVFRFFRGLNKVVACCWGLCSLQLHPC